MEKITNVFQQGYECLRETDPELTIAFDREHQRHQEQLILVASSSVVDPAVLFAQCTDAVNTTAEGYPKARFHAGCVNVDEIEQLAIERAKTLFNAQYANVQAHSASTANLCLISSILKQGDTLLGMDLNCGGHLTHGAKPSFSGQNYESVSYHINKEGFIDYDEVSALAKGYKPKLIICGTTAYSRIVDFKKFYDIAMETGAYLLADISHVSGLVAAGLYPSPIDLAHFTTTCTHKQLYGPRGALIMGGQLMKESKSPNGDMPLENFIQKSIFPYFQGAPVMNRISAIAYALKRNNSNEFKEVAFNIKLSAHRLAEGLKKSGYKVVSGGTDTHIILIDMENKNMTGYVAEKALEQCDIIVNKNRVPGDTTPAFVSRGIRLGTNTIAYRGYTEESIEKIIYLFDRVISNIVPISDKEYSISSDVVKSVKEEVHSLSLKHPIPKYGWR